MFIGDLVQRLVMWGFVMDAPFIKIEITPHNEEPYDPTESLMEFIRHFKEDPRLRESSFSVCSTRAVDGHCRGMFWLTTNCTLVRT